MLLRQEWRSDARGRHPTSIAMPYSLHHLLRARFLIAVAEMMSAKVRSLVQ